MKKLWLFFLFSIALAIFAQNAAPRHTILDQTQVPPVPAPLAAAPIIFGEIPTPGVTANTWNLAPAVTAPGGPAIFWNGLRQTVGVDFTYAANPGGGTVLTLTPSAIAINAWQTGTLVADYQ